METLLSSIDQNEHVKRLFHVTNVSSLKKLKLDVPFEREGYMTWSEFLELLFSHKRLVRRPSEEAAEEEEERKRKQKEEAARQRAQRATHQVKGETGIFKKFPKRVSLSRRLRAKSVKPRRRAEDEEGDVSFEEKKLGDYMLSGKDYRKHYKSLSKSAREEEPAPDITVPKPFRFTEREANKRKTIRQQWLEGVLEEKRLEEDNMLNHQFRANKIPVSTKEPRYEKIKALSEFRRAEVKKNSIAITKAREKPFSFYARDKDFYVNRAKATEQHVPETMKNFTPFKATPIPWSVSAQLLDQMQAKEEKEREERVKKRAQELLAMSKLPPRMEMHEMSKKQGALVQQSMRPQQENFTFKPREANPVPDFKMQHYVFQKTLEKHKKQKRPTVPRPFNFRETKKRASIREYMDTGNVPQVEIRPKTTSDHIAALDKPSINPPTTAKMVASMELKRKHLEERRAKELRKSKEDTQRQDKLKKLAPMVRSQIKDNAEKLKKEAEDKIRRKKEELRESRKRYQDWVQKMENDVHNRPLLMTAAEDDRKKKAGKIASLRRMQEVMKASGAKDTDALFTPEERDMLRADELARKAR